MGDYPIDNTAAPSTYDNEWEELFKGSTVSTLSSTSNEPNFSPSLLLSPPTTVTTPDTSSKMQNPVLQFDSPVIYSSDSTPQSYIGQSQGFSELEKVLSVPVQHSTTVSISQLEGEQQHSSFPRNPERPRSRIAVPSQLPRPRRPGRPRKEDMHRVHVTANRQIHNNSASRSRAKFFTVFENLWSLVPEEVQSRDLLGCETIHRRGTSRAKKGQIVIEYLRELQGKVGCN
jgi:hypothetical protein